MTRTRYPHRRHISFDDPLYHALDNVTRWRRCSIAAYVREAVEVAARAEHAARRVSFPPDHVEVLPGQLAIWPAAPPAEPGEPPPGNGAAYPSTPWSPPPPLPGNAAGSNAGPGFSAPTPDPVGVEGPAGPLGATGGN